MKIRPNPHLFEINTAVFLNRLSAKSGKKITLGSVPPEEWQKLADQGFEIIWLMGVWKRSPASRKIAAEDPDLQNQYRQVLPDWRGEDVIGSPYAIAEYTTDPLIGTMAELQDVRAKLNKMGMGLILDFIPNHVAIDHPWVTHHQEDFICGNEENNLQHPGFFFKTERGDYMAHGRDPYFPAWTDTAQLNLLSEKTRNAQKKKLLEIAKYCDGVRCDMAMLAINRVFKDIWHLFLSNTVMPPQEYWHEMIAAVKKQHPDFIFMAEAYWNLEQDLGQLGFDFAYDKKLYDFLRYHNTKEILQHLKSQAAAFTKSVHFIENHDEPRSYEIFGPGRVKAAAVLSLTLPGMRLLYDGQLEGRKTRHRIQLGREQAEPVHAEDYDFYQKLLAFSRDELLHSGTWSLLDAETESHQSLIAWQWSDGHSRCLIIINYAPYRSTGKVRIKPLTCPESCRFKDVLSGQEFNFIGEAASWECAIDLEPWHFLLLKSAGED